MRKVISWIVAVVFAALFFLAVPAQAQEQPPEPNQGVRLEACATYSVNGKAADQATELCARVPVTSRFSLQYATVFAPNLGDAAGVNFHFGEVFYGRNLADFLKRSSPQFNPRRVELFAFGGIGTARNAIAAGNASFAWSVGGGGRFNLNANTAFEARYRYVRSRIVEGGALLRSDHQLPVGLVFSWGK